MTTMNLDMTQEELRDAVVARVADRAYESLWHDDGRSMIHDRIESAVRKRVDEAVDAAVEKEVLPIVQAGIDSLVLQPTNRWGEEKGEPMTWREYAVKRAETYMTEKVNYEGKSKDEARGGFSGGATQTRISHMVHKHLHYTIEHAMQDALKNANSQIVDGIQKTVEIKLKEIAAKLKVSVNT